MGAYTNDTIGVSPNLFVNNDGQIMRISAAKSLTAEITRIQHPVSKLNINASASEKIIVNAPGTELFQTVSVSPDTELPDGLIIAYARVCDPGQLEIKFMNISGKTIRMKDFKLLLSIY